MIRWNELPRDLLKVLRRDLDVGEVIPRALKSDDEKSLRSLSEVFTPAQVVKFMVDALELEKLFWQARVDSKCLEVACGEAPFITTRYDAESGEFIPVNRRVGVLDRKFQSIQADKNFWAIRAVQSVYGYELQADSLLIARANVLMSFVEFVEIFSADELREVAEIVTKNFWLMDGQKVPDAQGSLFDTNEIKITDWLTGHEKFFTGGNSMKFDFLVSNPPYQDDKNGSKNFAPPIYHQLMEVAHKAADTAVLITPARFLFDAGATPKEFNRKMLDDPHLKVLSYEPNAGKLFRNAVDIEGGVVITIHDKNKNFGAIGTFTPWQELNSIHQKVVVDNPNFKPLIEIIYSKTTYKLTKKFHDDNPDAVNKISKGHASDFATNLIDLFGNLFHDEKPDDGHDYIQVHGRQNNERVCKWFCSDWVTQPVPLNKFKVLVPLANGAGAIGKVDCTPLIGTPFISEPLTANTATYITIGAFDTRDEAEICMRYIKSKFARAMLGILKVTPVNPASTWAKVPLQDFTSESDIDWSGDVDAQLYRKYGLSDEEISFIESHVKAMS